MQNETELSNEAKAGLLQSRLRALSGYLLTLADSVKPEHLKDYEIGDYAKELSNLYDTDEGYGWFSTREGWNVVIRINGSERAKEFEEARIAREEIQSEMDKFYEALDEEFRKDNGNDQVLRPKVVV